MVKCHSKRLLRCTALLLAMLCCFAFSVSAAYAPCESGSAVGHYRHPVSNTIEDSGGESSFALGQSMVESVVSGEAMLETAADGNLYLSLRFNLMSNISDVDLKVQRPNDDQWTSVGFDRTAEGEDSADLRLPVPARDAIVRAECFVDAMGRSVIFYVTVDGFAEGNTHGFTQMDASFVPSPAKGESKPAGATVAAPAGETNTSTGTIAGQETVGLVTGGSKAGAAEPAAAADKAHAGEAGTLTIGPSVWVMFFLVTFCACLLACLVFWVIRTAVEKAAGRKSAAADEELTSALAQAEDEDEVFETDFSDDDWMEDEHENP